MSRAGRFPQAITPLAAVLTLPVGILAALFVGLQAALAVFVVGWLLLVPASAILFGAPDDPVEAPAERGDHLTAEDASDETSEDPIEALRDRYARGEIDEAELERRLDALVELEDVDADDEAGIERALDRLDAVEDREEDLETERE